jgi:hypothetical protein
MPLYIGMVGSRNYKNADLIFCHVKAFSLRKDITLVSGGVGIVDKTVEKAANEYSVPIVVKYPKIEEFGSPAAFHIRNDEILNMGLRKLMIYWNGVSPGSKSMKEKAEKRRIDYSVFYERPQELQTLPC